MLGPAPRREACACTALIIPGTWGREGPISAAALLGWLGWEGCGEQERTCLLGREQCSAGGNPPPHGFSWPQPKNSKWKVPEMNGCLVLNCALS